MSLAWITGAGGLIGNYIVQTAPQFAAGWRVRGLKHGDLDLLDFAAVQREFQKDKPDLIIHCAAVSNTVHCEQNPENARRLNVEVPALLAELAANSTFVLFSSDLVFDGRRGNYDETAAVNPLGVYAETKVAAEEKIRPHPRHIIIRTALNGGMSPKGNRGFNEQMRLAWQRGETVKVFTDEFRCPSPAIVTARATWELALKNQPGTYHVAGAERLSRFELGQLIAARWPQLHPKLQAGSLKEYQGAPRPPDTSLNCSKAQKLLSFPLPHLSAWLAAHPDEPF
jgi:dTDP-4-dehydrorhamnose reductase